VILTYGLWIALGGTVNIQMQHGSITSEPRADPGPQPGSPAGGGSDRILDSPG